MVLLLCAKLSETVMKDARLSKRIRLFLIHLLLSNNEK